MKFWISFSFFVFVIISGCSDKGTNNKPENFTGITYTDINGNINGTVDTDDWHIQSGTPPYKSREIYGPLGGLPDSFEVKPAYPNPTDGIITLTFAFPVALEYDIRIIDKYRHVLARYDSTADAGFLTINWAPVDSAGHPLPADIYRVVYQFYGLWGKGDIQVVP
ncbi:conserved hypothetical protein [Candidatus Zixiibacteriota bacterium]|nr:conserved hypothetical protein [candidate division Zixibacteria bacterium]